MMKNKFAFFIILFIYHQFGIAQIKPSGTPYSFGSHFKSLSANHQEIKLLSLPKVDWQKVKEEDENTVNSNRFAVAIPANLNLQNAGKWVSLSNGDRLWRIKIHSENAQALRVLFEKFYLPEGAKLFIYSEDKQQVLGSFTHLDNPQTGRKGTDIIFGDIINLEYYEPQSAHNQGVIDILRIDHAYRNIEKKGRITQEKAFGESGSCNVNVNCNLGADWQTEKRGVVKIIATSVSGLDWCSGSLINNTALDKTPYILTANHCLGNRGQAFIDTWGFIFNYETIACLNPNNDPNYTLRLDGADIIAKDAASDFLLLKLKNTIPSDYDVYFNGWDKSGIAPTSAVAIHHPNGDVKKISVDNDAPTSSTFPDNQVAVNKYWQVIWNDNTTTEGGSSGSPLFSQEGKIIGQLHGGDASCSVTEGPDWFGKLAESWEGGGLPDSRLKDWLNPVGQDISSLAGLENFQLNNDISLNLITPVLDNCDLLSNKTFKIKIYNKGKNNLSNLQVNYQLLNANSQVIKSDTYSISQLNSQNNHYTEFTINLPSTGQTYTFSANSNLSNVADDNPANNTNTRELIIPQGEIVITNFPYIESFENGSSNWNSGGSNNSWALGSPNKSKLKDAAEGTKAWVTNLATAYNNDENSYLLSPYFNFTGISSPAILFNIYQRVEEKYDAMQLQVSIDCGQTWARLGDLNQTSNWYDNNSSELPFLDQVAWSKKDSVWRTAFLPLTAYANQAKVRFRFLFRSDSDNESINYTPEGFAIDNVRILDAPTALENTLKTKIKVYPNPSNENLFLEKENNFDLSKSLKIRLYDVFGKTVLEIKQAEFDESNKLMLPIQSLKSGMYILRLESEKGNLIQKIVKQ